MGFVKNSKISWLFCAILLLFLTLTLNASVLKLKVVIDKAEIREEPNISSSIIAKVPIEAVLESSGKSGEWYKVSFKYRGKFTISGYIHQSFVYLIGIRKTKEIRKEREEKPTEIREQMPPKTEPKYVPKKASKRSFAFSLSPSYDIVSMSDLNKRIDALNPSFSSNGYKEMENLKGGLDLLFFEGKFFLLSKLALGFQIGKTAREGNTDYLEQELKVSGLSLTLNGYYYISAANKFSPYIGAGIGLIFSKFEFGAYGGDLKADYTGNELEFHFVGGIEYFLFSSLSIGGEIGYRVAKAGTIEVKESDFSGEEKGDILIWDPANPGDHWHAIPEGDFEYYRNQYGYERFTTDFSGLSFKFKLSYYF